MLKRSATSELNHTNWDQDDEEPDKPSDFKLASAEVMSKRIIKTGKRRLAGANVPSVEASTPFSKFSFGGVSSQSTSSPHTTPSFNFSSSVKTPTDNRGAQTMDAKKDDSKDKLDETRTTYLGKLKGLNEEMLSWIDNNFKKNPYVIFTPAFDDYNRYLKEIQRERDTKSSTPALQFSADPAPKTTTVTSFLGSTSVSPPVVPSSGSDEPKASPADKPLGSSIFGNTTSKTDQPLGSIFGNAAAKPNDAPFSFGGAKPFSFGNVANPLSSSSRSTEPASEVQNDEDSEEPPKNEFKPVTEDDAVFSQRVKVFVKKDADYADRGVGTLFIKPANNKFQAVVRADTSLGNLLLNIILTESIPIKRMGNNNIMLVCVPLPGTDSKPLPTLLKVKTKEEADKLFDKLTKYQV